MFALRNLTRIYRPSFIRPSIVDLGMAADIALPPPAGTDIAQQADHTQPWLRRTPLSTSLIVRNVGQPICVTTDGAADSMIRVKDPKASGILSILDTIPFLRVRDRPYENASLCNFVTARSCGLSLGGLPYTNCSFQSSSMNSLA